jgi:hypothetical protein
MIKGIQVQEIKVTEKHSFPVPLPEMVLNIANITLQATWRR